MQLCPVHKGLIHTRRSSPRRAGVAHGVRPSLSVVGQCYARLVDTIPRGAGRGRLARFVLGVGLLAVVVGNAAPFVPTDEGAIVETLRDRPLDRTDLELRELRRRLRAAPVTLPLALAVAQNSIAIARRDGDPRYLGYAQAALMPWWSSPTAPETVRLLKATLLQSVHQFYQALDELRRVLESDPRNAQAWLTQASILQVQGRYADAAASCKRLGSLGAALYGAACLAELASLTGDATAARVRLATLVATDSGPSGSWLHLMQAELEERIGDFVSADRDFGLALALSPDAYTKAAYADFLLDRNHAQEVIPLLEKDQRADPLLLRLALAYRATKNPALAASVATLAARFDAARLRGDRVHQREEARFQLYLVGHPDEALRLALANWAVQREPADARILLEAAQAAHYPEAADPVRDFVRRTGLTDQRLTRFL